MTTTVIIKAHCASNKEVRVLIKNANDGFGTGSFTLQDGDCAEHVIYNEREIVVKEVLK